METDDSLVHFLLTPKNYPEKSSHVTHYETHISHIFLCDDFVYKVKKPVDFGFLNFSTLKKRYFYCNKEVILNSRLARDTYLGVEAIYRKGDKYSFYKKEGGSVFEYAVKMRRLPHDCILYNLIEEGRPLYGALEEVGKTLALFHEGTVAYKGRKYGGLETVISITEENFKQIKPFCGVSIDKRFYRELIDYTRAFISKNRKTFSKRKKNGYVREGHGDLHSQHVCLTHPPTIFDCIEFNEKFRIIDVLEDIAFLFMDLEYKGRFDLSTRLFKAYFAHQRDNYNEELLRFYKIYRAVIRGKVEVFRAHNAEEETTKKEGMRMAGEYFKLADYYIHHFKEPFNPVVFMGLSGSGKSTIAKDFSPDWIVLRSDEIRKTLLGVKKKEHLYSEFGKGIYTDKITNRIYHTLLEKAISNVLKGKRVVVDATYLQSAHRKDFYQACVEKGLNPFFVHCFADEKVLKERIKKRIAKNKDISDAHLDTLNHQIKDIEEPKELPYYRVLRLNTEERLHNIINALKEFL